MERIKEQPRAFRHAPLIYIQKCLQRIFVTLYFVRTFFLDYLFLQRFISCTVFFLDYLLLQQFILRANFFDYLFL